MKNKPLSQYFTRSSLISLHVAIACFVTSANVNADTYKWTPSSILDNDWGAHGGIDCFAGATNWDSTCSPSNGDSLEFGRSDNNFSYNDYDDIDLVNITFLRELTSTHFISGNQIDLKSGGISTFSTAVQSIENKLSLQGTSTIQFFAGADGADGQLNLSGNITDSVLHSAGADYSFVKSGSGNLFLSGNNGAMHGDINISGGKVILGDSNALSNNSTVRVGFRSTLDFNGTGEKFGGLSGVGTVDLSDGAEMNFGFNNQSTLFSGDITSDSDTSASMSKNGIGNFYFQGDASNFKGDIYIKEGSFFAYEVSEFSNESQVNVEFNGQFSLSDAAVSFNTEIGSLSGSGTVSLNNNDLTMGLNNRNSAFYGVVEGEGDLIKTGSGTFYLEGENTFTGDLVVSQGQVKLGAGDILQGGVSVQQNGTLDLGSEGERVALVELNGGNIISSGGALYANNNVFDLKSGNVSAELAGSGRIVKHGVGTVNLSGTQSYTGGVNIYSGTLVAESQSLKGNIYNLATLTVESNTDNILFNEDIVIENAIYGSGTFRKSGSGTVEFTGAGIKTYTGNTHIDDGTLYFDGSNTSSSRSSVIMANNTQLKVSGTNTVAGIAGNSSNYLTMLNNAHLIVDNDTTYSYGGIMSGQGSLEKRGDGRLNLYGYNSLSNGLIISEGTVEANASSLGSYVVNNSSLNIRKFGTTDNFSGNISGSGVVNKVGVGSVTFSGTEKTYSGQTNVQAGTLVFEHTNSSSKNSGLNIHNGARVVNNGANTVKYLSSDPDQSLGELMLNGDLTIDTDTTNTYYGSINASNSGAQLIKQGNGVQYLLGQNDLSGGVRIDKGTLVGHASSLNGDIENNAKLVLTNGTGPQNYQHAISGNGQVQVSSDVIFSGEAKSYSGDTVVDRNYSLSIYDNSSSANSIVNLNGTLNVVEDSQIKSLEGVRSDALAVIYSGVELTITDAQTSFSGAISGQGGLRLLSGKQELSGANTYTGNTTVSNGHLVVAAGGEISNSATFTQNGGHSEINGTLQQGEVIINNGLLSGSGVIQADLVTVGSAATINPGNSPGTLILMSDLNMKGALVTEIESLQRHDQLKVMGEVALSSSSVFEFIFEPNYVANSGDEFTFLQASLFNFGSLIDFATWADFGRFAVQGLSGAFDWEINFTDNSSNGSLSYLSILLSNSNTDISEVNAPASWGIFLIAFFGLAFATRVSQKRKN